MSKKKKGNQEPPFGHLFGELEKMLGQMDEDQLSQMSSLFSGDQSMDDILNERYYFYDRPNYASLGADVSRWLMPLWNAQNDDNKVSLCGFVDDDGRELSLEQKRLDLRHYLYMLFDCFDPKIDGQNSCWKLYGALWLLEKYKMTDCLDNVLEVLRQDARFFTFYIHGCEDYLSAVLYQLGRDQLEVLENFMYESGLIPDGKPIVFDALILTALRQPEKRLRIVSMASKYLRYCLDICRKGANPSNLELYAGALATGHIHELRLQLRELYNELDFPHFMYDGIEEVEAMMDNEEADFLIECDNLNDFLLQLKNEKNADNYGLMPYGDFGFDDEDDDEDYDEDYDYDDDYEAIKNTNTYYLKEKPKRLTLRIELDGAPEPVQRTLQVPSNMYLSRFVELIMTAFGRNDEPEQYVFTERDGFRFVSDFDDWDIDDEEMDEVDEAFFATISDVLKKKNDFISFGIAKNRKVVWHHTILLEKSGRYTEKTQEYVLLLDGQGAYPAKSVRTMEQYIKQHQEGKLRRPNFKTVHQHIREFEDFYEPPI